MATTEHLQALYRRLSARAPAPAADAVARLADGERDEDVLLEVASSAAGSDALAIALASAEPAQALAQRAWRARAGAERTPRRAPALPVAWLAAAAAIAFGFTVMLKLSAPPEPARAPVADRAATPAADDVMMGESFEESAAVADSFEAAPRPELFSDDFDA